MKQFMIRPNLFKSLNAMSNMYVKQVFWSFLIKILSVFISFIYIPIVLGFLNQEKYGIWITLTTVVNWIRVLDVGMGNGMRNKLAESIALNDNEKGKIYISTTYGILGSIFFIVLIIFFIVNPFLNWQSIINSRIISSSELELLTRIVVSFIIIGFVLQPINLIYEAHGNSAAGGIIQLIISSLTFFLVWFVSKFSEKGDIIILAWIVTGVPILVYLLVTAYTFLIRYPNLLPSFKHIKYKASGNLISLSFQFFALQLTATIVFSSIPFVVAHLFSPNEVTIYNITNSIFNIPIMVMNLITAPLLPLVTHAYTRNDYHWIKIMLRRMNIISAIITCGIIFIVFLSPIIFRIWIGDKLVIPFNLSVFIGLYSIINVIMIPFSIFINAIGKIRVLVLLAPVGIILFIGFSILLSDMLGDLIAIPISLTINSLIGLFIIPITLKRHNLI